MRKLSLDVDALRVDTFDPTPRTGVSRGTVRGNDAIPPTVFTCDTLVPTTTDPNLQCMCQSGRPCVETLETACGPTCI